MPIELMKANVETAAPPLVHRIYNAARITLGLMAAVMVATIVILVPTLEREATVERQRAEEIADENRVYCEKRGLRAGTKDYASCSMDLDDIRARHERRILDQMESVL
jgi:hypothetical protein